MGLYWVSLNCRKLFLILGRVWTNFDYVLPWLVKWLSNWTETRTLHAMFLAEKEETKQWHRKWEEERGWLGWLYSWILMRVVDCFLKFSSWVRGIIKLNRHGPPVQGHSTICHLSSLFFEYYQVWFEKPTCWNVCPLKSGQSNLLGIAKWIETRTC